MSVKSFNFNPRWVIQGVTHTHTYKITPLSYKLKFPYVGYLSIQCWVCGWSLHFNPKHSTITSVLSSNLCVWCVDEWLSCTLCGIWLIKLQTLAVICVCCPCVSWCWLAMMILQADSRMMFFLLNELFKSEQVLHILLCP